MYLCSMFVFFFLMIPRPPTSTLFPYMTLFRSLLHGFRHGKVCAHNLLRDTSGSAQDGRRPGSFQPDPARFRLYLDRKSTRLNSSHTVISYAVFCLKKKKSERKRIV